MLEYFFEWSGRDLNKLLKAILHQNLAEEVIRENYLAKYTKNEKKIDKIQVKKLYFKGAWEKLENFLAKNKDFTKCK